MRKFCENCNWFDPLPNNEEGLGECALNREIVSPKNYCDFYDKNGAKEYSIKKRKEKFI